LLLLTQMIQPHDSSLFQEVGLERCLHEGGEAFARLGDERPLSGLTSRAAQRFPERDIVGTPIERFAQQVDGFAPPVGLNERAAVGSLERAAPEGGAVSKLPFEGGDTKLRVIARRERFVDCSRGFRAGFGELDGLLGKHEELVDGFFAASDVGIPQAL
jgi:hypothetical protein